MGNKHYDKAFKERAVELSKKRGNINGVARELGISGSQRSKWRRAYEQYGKNSFPGHGIEQLTA